jgi:hypothetical protein
MNAKSLAVLQQTSVEVRAAAAPEPVPALVMRANDPVSVDRVLVHEAKRTGRAGAWLRAYLVCLLCYAPSRRRTHPHIRHRSPREEPLAQLLGPPTTQLTRNKERDRTNFAELRRQGSGCRGDLGLRNSEPKSKSKLCHQLRLSARV